jgi:hypothetical protein
MVHLDVILSSRQRQRDDYGFLLSVERELRVSAIGIACFTLSFKSLEIGITFQEKET